MCIHTSCAIAISDHVVPYRRFKMSVINVRTKGNTGYIPSAVGGFYRSTVCSCCGYILEGWRYGANSDMCLPCNHKEMFPESTMPTAFATR